MQAWPSPPSSGALTDLLRPSMAQRGDVLVKRELEVVSSRPSIIDLPPLLPPRAPFLPGISDGGKRCSAEGCTSRAKHFGRCWRHGGSVECKAPGCPNRAKSRGYCWSHGGGTKCKTDNCEKIAISNGLCWAHGGGRFMLRLAETQLETVEVQAEHLSSTFSSPDYHRTYRELLCTKLSTNFREATEIVTHSELPKASAGHVVVKNKYLGVNATDINVTNGVFNENPPPFGTGLDAAGTVVEVGPDVTEVKMGDYVVYDKFGAYAEYVEVPIGSVHTLPELSPAALPLTVCGISASIAITECGELSTNETVFVTAAAGGAGQFVVQLAKMAGNHVIGTCSNDEKVEHLKKLGCDRVINYNKESIDAVLKKEYPKGIDIAFETIGGEMFKTVFDNMAIRGRIIVFGHISEYRGDTPRSSFTVSAMNEVMLMKAITVRGFLLRTYSEIIPKHMANLLKLIKEGKLQAGVDPTKFHGLEQVPDAIDHMYAHKNIGKIVIELPTEIRSLP
ncbi:hypothetical protein BBI17_005692 [Phytophthora kernoviae]|uniref:Enoyl reductase (ER) domain-containing protein n=1 Tax=Phytophthora kernoviae TaxID=325452 RepID=A0A421EU76_9STRA|nr:hypothetical protein BBI17_005692 [Phytophthora kernoviae]